jgi:AcrR family transcriptional regulator
MSPEDKARFKARIRAAALPLFRQAPPSDATIKRIAEALGASYWSVYRQYDAREALYRDVVSELVGQVGAGISIVRDPALSVSATVHAAVHAIAGLMSKACYRDMLLFVFRDAAAFDWLYELYQANVLERFTKVVEALVLEAGKRHELVIGIEPGAAVRAVRTLETMIVLPRLLPGAISPKTFEVKAALDAAASGLMSATYAIDFSPSEAAA